MNGRNWWWMGLMVLLAGHWPGPAAAAAQRTPGYEYRAPSADGIGKLYCGREIAQVMSHAGAGWLERPEREREEQTDLLIESLKLRPGEIVADLGAGTGYLTRRVAGKVSRVYAVEIQPEMLEVLSNRLAGTGFTNVVPILGTEQDPRLPAESVDTVLMVDVYHEFEYPREMMEAICRALKPGGRVVFVEYRAEDPAVPIKALHKMSEAQVKIEMASWPLQWFETGRALPWQHLIVFRKKN